MAPGDRLGNAPEEQEFNGLIVICCFISPYRADRDAIRAMASDGEFIEVFVDTPLEEGARRVPRGSTPRLKDARSRTSRDSVHPTTHRKNLTYGSRLSNGPSPLSPMRSCESSKVGAPLGRVSAGDDTRREYHCPSP